MNHPKTVHVLIEGKVQGVWYRGWTVEAATERGLNGWVRNLHDGRVEAVFSGPTVTVDAMITDCRQGPPSALVHNVTAEPWTEIPGHGFHQRATA
ncbi:MAG: acylphosphatase [Rhodospirillaceae bacterium]|nr:acylphosphatase [Rhodospirillales bacterium]